MSEWIIVCSDIEHEQKGGAIYNMNDDWQPKECKVHIGQSNIYLISYFYGVSLTENYPCLYYFDHSFVI